MCGGRVCVDAGCWYGLCVSRARLATLCLRALPVIKWCGKGCSEFSFYMLEINCIVCICMFIVVCIHEYMLLVKLGAYGWWRVRCYIVAGIVKIFLMAVNFETYILLLYCRSLFVFTGFATCISIMMACLCLIVFVLGIANQ
jgi:hypothetical protein